MTQIYGLLTLLPHFISLFIIGVNKICAASKDHAIIMGENKQVELQQNLETFLYMYVTKKKMTSLDQS
jgi:ABC-type polysaccharide transport system permease subunit